MNTYTIKKVEGIVEEKTFEQIPAVKLEYMWEEFPVKYNTYARLVYTEEAIYVNMKTDEKPLTAKENKRDSLVCCDSCMEFFLSPDIDDKHYFNFEINPLGTILVHYGEGRSKNQPLSESEDVFDIRSVITKDDWQLYYKIPFSVLLKYFKKITPEIRGNFYKCGDKTPYQHYMTWNPVLTEKPDYHRPEYFGTLVFEKGISIKG